MGIVGCRLVRRMASAAPISFTLLCLPGFLVGGCRSAQEPTYRQGEGRSAGAAKIAVTALPEYREARNHFQAKDYRGALVLLDRLRSHSEHLTQADQNFLSRQQAICQNRLSGISGGAPRPLSGVKAATQSRRKDDVSSVDCGPRALLLACRELNTPTTLPQLALAAGTTCAGTTLAGLQRAAQSLGLSATGVQMDQGALANLSRPAVAWVEGDHYLAVLRVHGDTATVHDPNKDRKEDVPLADLLARSGGVLLTLAPRAAQ